MSQCLNLEITEVSEQVENPFTFTSNFWQFALSSYPHRHCTPQDCQLQATTWVVLEQSMPPSLGNAKTSKRI